MEKSRSWPSAHDWKSCKPQKGFEGSNPSFSAIDDKFLMKLVVFLFPCISLETNIFCTMTKIYIKPLKTTIHVEKLFSLCYYKDVVSISAELLNGVFIRPVNLPGRNLL